MRGTRWARGGRVATALAFAAGLAVRLWGLPFWGTFDVEVQKAWSARAATGGVADIYGPPDRELSGLTVPKATFQWGSATYFVDYPPGSVLVLWAAGKLYRSLAPEMPNRTPFNVAINLAPLLASVAIAGLLLRTAPDGVGIVRALAFWLNPAVILAAPILGYQDTIFGVFALGAVLLMMDGRHVAAAALVVVAGLVKPQGVLLLPTLVALLVREGGLRTWIRAVGAGTAAALIVLAPWWTSGYLLSALHGSLRPLGQGTLAPLGLNVWWIAGYCMRWSLEGPWPLADIVGMDAFRAWAGFEPRTVSRALLAVATLANVVLLTRGDRADRRLVPLSVIFQVHAYGLLGTSVHENHTFLAVVLAPLLLGVWPRAWALLAGTSAFLFASLFLAAGLGRRITTLAFLESLRRAPLLDATVIVACAHVVLVAFIFVWMARTARPEPAAPDARMRP